MKKSWLIMVSLAVVMMTATVAFAGCAEGSVSPITGSLPSDLRVNFSSQQEGLWVSGSGKVSVVPDIAVLRLGIEAQETSVAEAQSQAAGAMEAVMAVLADSGVAEKDIQTQYFNIHRVTRWDDNKRQEVVIGYRVTNMVSAKIREMDGVGAIVDAVAAAGGDLTRIDDVSFSVEDPSNYHDEAREKAMADARAKAEQLAELAGVKLGRPIYISESAYIPSPVYRQPMYEQAAGTSMPETSISPGEMEISLNVQLVYAISD